MRGGDFQNGVQPITPTVKKLIIINVVIWFAFVMILQNFILKSSAIYEWFGLVPFKVITHFWFWQPFTYIFIHSENVFHIVFNMLLLWWLGSELEIFWGKKFFLFYYLACGVGAGLIYLLGVTVYYLISSNMSPLLFPVVGASGAVFGMLVAYGMLFGERTVLFFMLFPMKARYFVMILGAIEVFNLIGQGFSNENANLAHVGGAITGYLILKATPKIREYLVRRRTETHGRRLKLVVDNDSTKKPKYWN